MTEHFDTVNIQYVKAYPSPWTGAHIATDNSFNLTVSLPESAQIETAQVVCKNLHGEGLDDTVVGCLVYFSETKDWGGKSVAEIRALLGVALGRLRYETGANVEVAVIAVDMLSGPFINVEPIPYLPEEDTQPNQPRTLLQAVMRDDYFEAESFLSAGADVNVRGKDDWTPLLESVSGSPELVELLLRWKADPDLCSEHAYSPLMRAAGLNRPEAVKLLVAAGADLMLRDNKGATALDMAIVEEHEEIAQLLEPLYSALASQVGLPAQNVGNHGAERAPERPPTVTLPVFLSSTFRDMHAERDYLRDIVFPRLEEDLHEWGVQIDSIDLRWGVDTTEEVTERAKHLQVLRVCLSEIRRARPFVIALLGERYGWIPPRNLLNAAMFEEGLEVASKPCSITELELRYGVLQAAHDVSLRVYIRNPINWQRLVAEGKASREHVASYLEESGELRERITKLKGDLASRFPGRSSAYSLTWNAGANSLTNLKDWGDRVHQDLLGDMREHLLQLYPAGPASVDARLTRLRRFLDAARLGFEGREDLIRSLVEGALAEGEDPQPVKLLLGSEGAGKSAVIARLEEELVQTGDARVLSWYVGATEESSNPDEVYREWTRVLAGDLDIPQPDSGETIEDAYNVFLSLLRQVQLQQRVVLLVDSVDRFSGKDVTGIPLPQAWPLNVRLIATSEVNKFSKWSGARTHLRVGELPPIDTPSASTIVHAVCQRYHRSLPDEIIDLLVEKRSPDGLRAGGNPLWLKLATDCLNQFDAVDYKRTEDDFQGSAEERLRQLLMQSARDLPPDLPALYNWILSRATRVHGLEWVKGVSQLLGATRSGLRERDLRSLLPTFQGIEWEGATFAAVRRTLRMHIEQNHLGAWSFARAGVCHAVFATREATGQGERELHSIIACHFLSLPESDPLRERELMFHLLRAEAYSEAVRVLARAFRVANAGGTPSLGAAMLLAIKNDLLNRKDGLTVLRELLTVTVADNDDLFEACMSISEVLTKIIEDSVSLELRASIAEVIIECFDRLAQENRSTTVRRALSVALGRHGEVLQKLGRLDSAEDAHRRALKIAREILGEEPDVAAWVSDVSVDLGRLARTLNDRGKAEEARALRREALNWGERLILMEDDEENRFSLVINYVWLADDCLELEQKYETRTALNRAKELMRSVGVDEIDFTRRMNQETIVLERLGNLELMEGNLVAATKAYRKALKYRRRNAHNAAYSLEYRFNLAVIHEKISDVLVRRGSEEEALRELELALQIRHELIEFDPANRPYQSGLSNTLQRIASLKGGADPDTRLRLAEEEVARWTERHDRGHEDASISVSRFESMVQLGDILAEQGDSTAATESYESALAFAETLPRADAPASFQRNLAVCAVKLGNVHLADSDPECAGAAFLRGLTALEEMAEPRRSATRTKKMHAGVSFQVGQAFLSRGSEAEAEPFFKQAHDELKELTLSGVDLGANLQQIYELLSGEGP